VSFETKELEFMRENTRKWKKRVSVLQKIAYDTILIYISGIQRAAEGLICFHLIEWY
jgi:hypothetical protein